MHRIKQIPEDFVVNEVSNVKTYTNGQYAYYLLKKINYTTIDALQILSNKFKIPLKYFGFAGNKDRNAVTEQKISIFRGSKKFEDIKFNNIELEYLGNGKEPISLGDLEGNEFIITLRNLSDSEIKKLQKLQNKKLKIPNFFGLQRFSKNNHLVGKEIVKRNFKSAVDLILKNKGVIEEEIKNYLSKNKNNYIEALRLVPLKTRKLFVHSYQSFLFNKIVKEFLKNSNKIKNMQLPVIGFGFEINFIKNKELKNMFKGILNEEKINPRDFVISQMPELTSEGNSRDLFFDLKFKITETTGDELNKNNKKTTLNFTLPKSCYATVALEYVFQQP